MAAADSTPYASRRWWRRLTTVRARTTAAATLIVGLALGLAATGLVVLLSRSLAQHIDAVAEARAEDIAGLVRQGLTAAHVVGRRRRRHPHRGRG